jgi:hypothetical protein
MKANIFRRRIAVLLIGIAAAGLLGSCADFFTTSWGKGFARENKPNLLKNVKVSAANVDELVLTVAGDPNASLELLKKISETLKDPKLSAADAAKLRGAALTTSLNAIDLTGSALTGLLDAVGGDMTNGDGLVDVFNTAISGFANLGETGDTLTAIFKDAKDKDFEKASGGDLALASVVILLSEAKKAQEDLNQDTATFLANFDPNSDALRENENIQVSVKLAAAANNTIDQNDPMAEVVSMILGAFNFE